MKIETTPLENHHMQMVVEIDPETFERGKHRAARKIAFQAKIPGFRPGKAPYDVIKRTYGEEAIETEAIEIILDDIYPKALEEAGIEPGAQGKLKEITSKDPLIFSFDIPLEAVVTLGAYRDIRLPYEAATVSDKEIEDFIYNLQINGATLEPVNRPAQEGDMVNYLLSGNFAEPNKDGETKFIEKGSYQSAIYPIEREPERDFPYKGFARGLIGLSVGDEKEFEYILTAEEGFSDEYIGQKVILEVKIESVKAMQLPELNDEFAHDYGQFENMEELRNAVRSQMETTRSLEYDRNYFNLMINKIKESSEFKYAPETVEHEMEHVKADLEQDLARQNLDFAAFLKLRNQTEEQYTEEILKPEAIAQLERNLMLQTIMKEEKIEVGGKELQQEYQQGVFDLISSGQFESVKKRVPQRELVNYLTIQAANRLLDRRLMQTLVSIGRGTYGIEPVADETPSEEISVTSTDSTPVTEIEVVSDEQKE